MTLNNHISLNMGEREEKKRRKSSPICLRNFSVNYERRGVNLSKWRVQIAIFEILNLGLPEYFRSRFASFRNNPACLGELRGNLLRLFPINRRKGVVPMIPSSAWLCISAVLG